MKDARKEIEELKDEVEKVPFLVTQKFRKKSKHLIFAFGLEKIEEHIKGLPIAVAKDIDDFFEGLSKKALLSELLEMVKEANPERIILLGHSKTKYVKFEQGKDLSFGPIGVMKKVVRFRNALSWFKDSNDFKLETIELTCLHPRYVGKLWHLNNLLAANKEKKKEVIKLLIDGETYPSFFSSTDLSATNFEPRLTDFFGLGSPEDFYDTYADQSDIGAHQFVFRRCIYQKDRTRDELLYIRHTDADMFLWVGDKTTKIIWKELNGGIMLREVKKYSHVQISREYGERFLDEIPQVDGLGFDPDNINPSAFLSVIHNEKEYRYFNMFQEPIHQPKKGNWANIEQFLKHLFPDKVQTVNGKPVNFYHVILDWLTIFYRYPKQILPIIGLISHKQQTGKTTFMDFLNYWQGNNAINMTMQGYLSNFNSHCSFKTLICIDEFEENALDKAVAKNKFKNQATAKNVTVELKGIDQELIPNYSKVVFATNSERPLALEEEDINRFWIHPVQTLPDGQRDSQLIEKMKLELPALLYFLGERQIIHPNVSRFWFDPNLFYTSYFQDVVKNTKPFWQDAVERFVRDTFLTYKCPTLPINPTKVAEVCQAQGHLKWRLTESQVEQVFKMHGYDKLTHNSVMSIPIGFRKPTTPSTENSFEVVYYMDKNTHAKPKGRLVHLKPEDWLNSEEMLDYSKPFEESIQEDHEPAPKLKPEQERMDM